MKKIVMLSFALVLTGGIGECAEPPYDSPNVPRTHWAYKTVDTLAQAWYGRETMLPANCFGDSPPVATRYEFAVAIARSIEAEGRNPQRDYDEKTRTYFLDRHDAFMALRREFATELSNLGVR
jgi:hypothetical protein